MKARNMLLSGALFYVFICPFFFHPDLKIIYNLASFFAQGVFNIYAHYSANPSLFPLGPFVYPPLAYFLLGPFFIAARLLAGPGFTHWLGMGNTAVQVEGIYSYLLAIKLPFIALHLLSGWLLVKIVADKQKTLVAALWFFNPVSIYIVALLGQIDGLAVVWIILAMVLAQSRPKLGAIALGLGAAVKSFPLLLLPLYVILVAKTWRQRIILIFTGVASYGVWIAPFLATPGFYDQTLTSSLSKGVLSAGVVLVLGVVCVVAFLKHAGRVEKLNNYLLLAGLAVLSGIHFHPQWALWALPMAVVYLAKSKKWWWGVLFLGGFLVNLLSLQEWQATECGLRHF